MTNIVLVNLVLVVGIILVVVLLLSEDSASGRAHRAKRNAYACQADTVWQTVNSTEELNPSACPSGRGGAGLFLCALGWYFVCQYRRKDAQVGVSILVGGASL